MATAYFYARRIGGDQGQADAQLLFFAQQVVGVVCLEGKAQKGRNRAEGDVAFFPVQAQANDFFALPLPFADHPSVWHGARIRACQWASKGKTGDVIATGQARQVVVTLLVGAVMQQQFRRAEGVRHHDRRRQVAAAGGEFHRNLRVGIGRKPFAAECLRNNQCKKTMLFDVCPRFGRQVHVLPNLPVADHCAQLFGRAVDKSLLFFGQLNLGVGQQFIPVGAAAEKFAIPPDCAGINGVPFGFGHGRQGLLEPVEQGGAKHFSAQVGQKQQCGRHRQQQPENTQ